MIGKCLNCEIEFSYRESQRLGKYCSNKCQQEYKFKTITITEVLNGRCRSIDAKKKYLRLTKGDVCVECGQGNVYNEKKLVLQLDHIDGNSDNNSVENLQLLCPNCHSQTETFGNKKGVKKDTKRNRYRRKEV